MRINPNYIDEGRMDKLKSTIELAWAEGPNIIYSRTVKDAVEFTLTGLDKGFIRVAERQGIGQWKVNQWVKKAVLLSFRLSDNKFLSAGDLSFFDKIASKFATYSKNDLKISGIRIVPPAHIRQGVFLAQNVVIMPSFINIGTYIDEGTMVDGWANVGSCAQIGKNVHISSGVCIGGVLEPLQANPTIIEDHCFIGANSSVVEGVIVEENSVIAMGVHLGQSTKILDRQTKQLSYGRIPSGSVVIAGMLPSTDGSYGTACAVIIKKVDIATRSKTSINELLRN